MIAIADEPGYLARLAMPMQEKLRYTRYFPERPAAVLDVGCADGSITAAVARMFPDTQFLGIDINKQFVVKARREHENVPNVSFEPVYLRELLARPVRYEVVVFCSVLHEFFTYGEGTSSVLKALADAHEILVEGGLIVVRDMILSQFMYESTYEVERLKKLIRKRRGEQLSAFEAKYGRVETVSALNHFLLKYMYTDNWERELDENYIPITFEQYEQIFRLLNMRLEVKESYLIPYLLGRWRSDFELSDTDCAMFKSTGILVARREG